MLDARIGAALRAARLRRDWRQQDLADRAHVARSTVAEVEAGRIGRLRLDTLERIGAALDVTVQVVARFRGGELDRLLSSRHAALHEQVARFLGGLDGWVFLPEVTFSEWGERGVIDILAWHEATGTLLVIELKTEIVDVQAVVGQVDRYRRLARDIARKRGWHARTVSVWLLVADSPTNRRHVRAHSTMLRAVLPLDGRQIRPWLRRPTGGPIAGLSFWSYVGGADVRRKLAPRKRVRLARARSAHAGGPPRTGLGKHLAAAAGRSNVPSVVRSDV